MFNDLDSVETMLRTDRVALVLTEPAMTNNQGLLATAAPPLTCEYSCYDGGAVPEVDPPQEPAEFGYCLSVRRGTLDPLGPARIAGRPGVTWLNHCRVVGLVGLEPFLDATT